MVFPAFTEVSNLASNDSFKMAKDWIEQCEQHVGCRFNQLELPLALTINPHTYRTPRHLIDVSDPEGPRVVVHNGLPLDTKYIALSYVWGKSQSYVLTRSTLAEKCSRLDLSRVPKTILDAIEVTRRLGYKYLWVDALCISQDSDSTEHNGGELRMMSIIYQKSEVTIIAANAASSAEGFLRVAECPDFVHGLFKIAFQYEDMDYLSAGCRTYYDSRKDPINSRAWTLQERILSLRCLLYSYSGLKWACNTCERNPSGPSIAPEMFPRLICLKKKFQGSDNTYSSEELRQSWLKIRNEYSQRNLTYGQDKLAAISAIAFEVSNDSGWTYLAGLWKEHLFLDLHWHRRYCNLPRNANIEPEVYDDEPKNPPSQRPEYRAPYWSWASIDGAVVDAEGNNREEFHFRILSCDVQYENAVPNAKFHFGPVRTGILIVQARLIELNWNWAWPDEAIDIYLDKIGDIVGSGIFDAEEPLLNEKMKIHCLAMSLASYGRHNNIMVEGLLLVESIPEQIETKKQFRRIGFFQIYDHGKSIFDDITEEIIYIS
jgi:hypothetical protein